MKLLVGLTLLASMSSFANDYNLSDECLVKAAQTAVNHLTEETGETFKSSSYEEADSTINNILVRNDGRKNIKVFATSGNSECTVYVKVTSKCKVKKVIPTYCQG